MIKGHFEDQWAPGGLHVDTVWKTILAVLLLQMGGFGIFKLIKWHRKRKAAKKATRAKAVWERWYGEQQKNHPPPTPSNTTIESYHIQPSAPPAPIPDGGLRGHDWDRARDRAITEEWALWRARQEELARQRGNGNSRFQQRELPPPGGDLSWSGPIRRGLPRPARRRATRPPWLQGEGRGRGTSQHPPTGSHGE